MSEHEDRKGRLVLLLNRGNAIVIKVGEQEIEIKISPKSYSNAAMLAFEAPLSVNIRRIKQERNPQ